MEIAEAIVTEKRHSKSFDLCQLWRSITPNRDYGTGRNHPFPHPVYTNKNAAISSMYDDETMATMKLRSLMGWQLDWTGKAKATAKRFEHAYFDGMAQRIKKSLLLTILESVI